MPGFDRTCATASNASWPASSKAPAPSASGGLAEVARTWARPNGDLASAFLAPAQRQALREIQVVMSLLEGFSDWVMDDIGADLLADVTVIRDRFEARRAAPRRGLDRIMARLTGLDLKLEQYRRGERFVSGIVAIGGQAALDRLWSGPDAIPTEAELDDPSAWARRMLTRPLA